MTWRKSISHAENRAALRECLLAAMNRPGHAQPPNPKGIPHPSPGLTASRGLPRVITPTIHPNPLRVAPVRPTASPPSSLVPQRRSDPMRVGGLTRSLRIPSPPQRPNPKRCRAPHSKGRAPRLWTAAVPAALDRVMPSWGSVLDSGMYRYQEPTPFPRGHRSCARVRGNRPSMPASPRFPTPRDLHPTISTAGCTIPLSKVASFSPLPDARSAK